VRWARDVLRPEPNGVRCLQGRFQCRKTDGQMAGLQETGRSATHLFYANSRKPRRVALPFPAKKDLISLSESSLACP